MPMRAYCKRQRESVSCSTYSRVKENRAPTAHHKTARAKRPMELVHIDTTGPFPASLGGSPYVVVCVDSASRLQRPYDTRDNSAAAILAVAKRFIADMGVPRAFRSDKGAQYMNFSLVEYCNNLGVRLELTAPYTPSTEWSRGERTMESLQSRTRGTSEGLEHLPGHPLGRSQGFYGRGGN